LLAAASWLLAAALLPLLLLLLLLLDSLLPLLLPRPLLWLLPTISEIPFPCSPLRSRGRWINKEMKINIRQLVIIYHYSFLY
jgi:hypothetical protein